MKAIYLPLAYFIPIFREAATVPELLLVLNILILLSFRENFLIIYIVLSEEQSSIINSSKFLYD
jgi:hypothetical protein|tara:strand:+ start:1134 stop:1325 length:192 start_codon:yes stop_codon:yes gene_type:complete